MLLSPALCASMRLGTMMLGGTLRMRIRKSCSSEMCTPDTLADIQRKKGTKWKKMDNKTNAPITSAITKNGASIIRNKGIKD